MVHISMWRQFISPFFGEQGQEIMVLGRHKVGGVIRVFGRVFGIFQDGRHGKSKDC